MTWFKVDGRFATAPEAVAAGPAAVGLWIACGSWSAAHFTDGFVPARIAHDYGSTRHAHRLVDVGLWDEDPAGYWFATNGRITYWEIDREQYRRKILDAIRRAVLQRDGHRCLSCGTADDLTMDHVYPWARGGQDTVANLQTLCMACNRAKGATV